MSQEIVGEVTVRSTQPEVVVAAASGIAGSVTDFVGTNLLAGPVTVRVSGDGREVMVGGDTTAAGARIHLDGATGNITVRDAAGNDILRFNNRFAVLDIGGTSNEGDIRVRNNDDVATIHLDGNTGDIRLINADAAEDFDVCSAGAADPGTVMVLEDDGLLHPSSRRFDSRVVGVVAGAGGFRPGLVLDRQEPGALPRAPISIMGKVSVKAVAEGGPIAVGHLLTSSSYPGAAMSVGNAHAPMGAVIGKALTPLGDGMGLVDMLVSLR